MCSYTAELFGSSKAHLSPPLPPHPPDVYFDLSRWAEIFYFFFIAWICGCMSSIEEPCVQSCFSAGQSEHVCCLRVSVHVHVLISMLCLVHVHTALTYCSCFVTWSFWVLAMSVFVFWAVLWLTEKPRTGPGDTPCNTNSPNDEYRPLSFCNWHVFWDL